MPAPHYTTADILDAQAHLPNLSLGPYQFFVNPWEFRVKEQRIQYTVPTKAGVARFSYGVMDRQYTITGSFWNSGLDGLNAAQHVAPTFKKAHTETKYYLTFAMFGIKRAGVYVNEFDYYVEQDNPHYIKYTWSLSELPPSGPAIVQVASYGVQGDPAGARVSG